MMQAWSQSKYGKAHKVLKKVTMSVPEIKEATDVLVKVVAVSLNSGDWRLMRGHPNVMRAMFGWRSPKPAVRGQDFSGIVTAVGADVQNVVVGDKVTGFCEIGGALAEFVCVKNDQVRRKPAQMSMNEASCLGVAAQTAYQALHREKAGNLKAGERVLINGASGGVGTFAIQLAKAAGASYVAAVCSTQKVQQALDCGADVAYDYKTQDYVQEVLAAGDDEEHKFDLIVENVGNRSLKDMRRVLRKDGGRVVVVSFGQLRNAVRLFGGASFRGMDVRQFMEKEDAESLEALCSLVESGKLRSIVEDRVYSFDDEVCDAMQYMETGRPKAKVVVRVAAEESDE